jgi:hypothetical protein
VLVIDGKNNNDDVFIDGKNRSDDGILAAMMGNMKETMIASRMRNYCLQAQEDENRAQRWSFQIAIGYHEVRKECAQDSLESVSLQKESS